MFYPSGPPGWADCGCGDVVRPYDVPPRRSNLIVVKQWTTTRTLERDACLALLQTKSLGRVALSDRALPVIVPVVYRTVGDAVEFETSGRLLTAAAHAGHVVCFEADDVDFVAGTGWSVNVVGPLHISAPSLVVPGRPWRHGARGTTVQLLTNVVSGREVLCSRPPGDAGSASDGDLAARSVSGISVLAPT